jgi:uncharacterized protein (DUF1697 family)
MADLRDLFVSLGYDDVSTFIQSGNVLFSSEVVPNPLDLESAVATCFGIHINVAVRSRNELRKALTNNPFEVVNPSRLFVGFMTKRPAKTDVNDLDHERFASERFSVVGAELYLDVPDGMASTKAPDYLNRRLKVPITMRNWNTVTKLLELTER